MRINRITLRHFRTHEAVSLVLPLRTVVSGDNGVGKSTLAEAVVWCLYGTDSTGAQKQDDRLLMRGKKDMAVSLECVNDQGVPLAIERIKTAKGTRFTVNGEKDGPGGRVETWFGSVDEFLSMFRPGYFSTLDPKEARQVLAKAAPRIAKADVEARLTQDQRDTLAYHPLAGGIESVEYVLSQKRQELREIQRELTRLQGEARHVAQTLDAPEPVRPAPRITDARRARQAEDQQAVETQRMEHANRHQRLDALRAKRKQLLAAYEQCQAKRQRVRDTCPTCGQSLPEAVRAQTTERVERHNGQIDERLAAPKQEGLTVKAEIERLEAMPPVATVDPTILARMRQYEIDEASDRELAAAYTAACLLRDGAQQARARIATDEQVYGENRDRLQQAIRALQAYRLEYVRLQHERMNAHFRRVKITLVDADRETGEVKPAFRIEWNGCPYRTLSYSERVRCDLEIAQVLAAAWGETMPVFVDDADLIRNLWNEPVRGQLIAVYVRDHALRVEAMQPAVAAS